MLLSGSPLPTPLYSQPPARTLAPRQRLFVEHYLIDLDGRAAAIRAGYTPAAATVRAAKLLRRPAVAQAVAAAMARRAARTQITAGRVIEEYARIAFADWRRFAAWGPEGVRFAASHALSAEDTPLIAELVASGRTKGGGGGGGLRRVKLFDKQAALASLLRILSNAETARFRLAAPSLAAPSLAPPATAPAPMPAPSARQRCFAAEFLRDFDASAAAIRAGYAPRSAPFLATKLRRYPAVAALIEAGIEARSVPIRIEADRVLLEYARIAFADIGRIAEWDAQHLRIKRKPRIAAGDSAAIEDIGPFGNRSGRVRVRLYDKVYALDALARHLGLLDRRMPGRALSQRWSAQRARAAVGERVRR
jgi:phage terminase small subunit